MAPRLAASNFALPLPTWAQPASIRSEHYDRKRKKSDDWTDETEGDTTDAASVADSAAPDSPLTLTPNESHQYRIAGLSSNQELPSGNFPHAPGYDKDYVFIRRNLPGQLLGSLPYLDVPLYPPQSAALQGNIRLQHLSALTAILHRSLLHGDYTRAGRAWGLLLRDGIRGMPLDIRAQGRWGIGAEILLRRGQSESLENADNRTPNSLGDHDSASPFTKKGFAEAKEYYERLILNHPFSKPHPNSISALHFYPAMFGLWIYVTQEESKMARKNVLERDLSVEEPSDGEDSENDMERREAAKRYTITAAVRAKELEQAQLIATRMDTLLGSPPYADSPQLLELRGMVSLWIGDLIVTSLPRLIEDSVDNTDKMTNNSAPGSLEARRAQRLAMEQKQSEVDKAKEFLEKAKDRGRYVAINLEHFHIHESSSPSPSPSPPPSPIDLVDASSPTHLSDDFSSDGPPNAPSVDSRSGTSPGDLMDDGE
ncbi:uncharacterized protein N7443_004995 [Penicillium atrosanguineum]|uniref:uncharacterized protein n=1 Tax=Penicillium atrosanguineum TaxID=1132637 RepID=UPI00239F532A|nr:uncharacterized protein N7443_004995 [Penicillium atrosanguineum]KAJ5305335.1 hypothetical protein N7443_004995 [Penicillium atrosanguineum]